MAPMGNLKTVITPVSPYAGTLKSTFGGLQRCRWQYRSIFIRLAVFGSKINEIPRYSLKNSN